MNKQETAQKILEFCQETYPELDWSFTSLNKTQGMIYGYRPILNSINGIQINNGIGISIEIIGTRLESHVVLGDVSAFISEARWSGSFEIWLDRKESQFSFKSKRELDTSTDLFTKAKDILSSIFEFIETEIQTEVTP